VGFDRSGAMANILGQLDSNSPAQSVRCPICGVYNLPMNYCRHVRWTFDQGDPIEFARFALETSPYTHNRGRRTSEIPNNWWMEHAEWVIERAMLRLEAQDGYVFGELSALDQLARDVWGLFDPEPARPAITRT
jgi:hypothetical protein